MHFVAMLAFTMPGMTMTYALAPTLASLGLAIAFTGAGLGILEWQHSFGKRIAASGTLIAIGVVSMHRLGHRLIAAGVMGSAIAGMHYVGMQAAIFTAAARPDEAQGAASLGQTYLALLISLLTVVILLFSLAAAHVERVIERVTRR